MVPDLMITFPTTSAQLTEPQRSQPPEAGTPETKVAAPQVEDLALALSLKNLKCCVRCSIPFLKTTCFRWALPAVARAVGQASALRDCPFSRALFFPRLCPWKWKPCLKTKCLRPAQCPHSRNLGASLKQPTFAMLMLILQAKHTQQHHWS